MAQYGLPILYVLFVWWFSTGLIIYLDALPRQTFRWTMLGTTALLLAALYGLVASRDDPTVAGAYHAFSSGLMVWGWLEVSFLLGYITGPRKEPCPEGCTTGRRFGLALRAVLYHELATAVGAAVVVAMTWGGANQVGAWTFLVLWGMRCSAKLNLFLGARNLNAEFLPAHLRFLVSYLPKKRMNLLFPLSITASTAILVVLVQRLLAADAAAATGLTVVAALMALAILEHWFLMLPLPDAALWKWALRADAPGRPFGLDIAADAAASGAGDRLLTAPSIDRRHP